MVVDDFDDIVAGHKVSCYSSLSAFVISFLFVFILVNIYCSNGNDLFLTLNKFRCWPGVGGFWSCTEEKKVNTVQELFLLVFSPVFVRPVKQRQQGY